MSSSNPLRYWRLYCVTEGQNVYAWNNDRPTVCPHDALHTINPSSIVDRTPEGLVSSTLYVDADYGNDGDLLTDPPPFPPEKNNPHRPWATLLAAMTAASSGEKVVAQAGTHKVTGNLVKNGVTLIFDPGAKLIADPDNPGITPFFNDGSGGAVDFTVLGFGEIDLTALSGNAKVLDFSGAAHRVAIQARSVINNRNTCLSLGGTNALYRIYITDVITCASDNDDTHAIEFAGGSGRLELGDVSHTGATGVTLGSSALGFTNDPLSSVTYNVFVDTVTGSNNPGILQKGGVNESFIYAAQVVGSPGIRVSAGKVYVESRRLQGNSGFSAIAQSGGALQVIRGDLDGGSDAHSISVTGSNSRLRLKDLGTLHHVAEAPFAGIYISGSGCSVLAGCERLECAGSGSAIKMDDGGALNLSVTQLDLMAGHALELSGSTGMSLQINSLRWLSSGASNLINHTSVVAASSVISLNVESIQCTGDGATLATINGATSQTTMDLIVSSCTFEGTTPVSLIDARGGSRSTWTIGNLRATADSTVLLHLQDTTQVLCNANLVELTGTGCSMVQGLNSAQLSCNSNRWLLGSSGVAVSMSNSFQSNLSVWGCEIGSGSRVIQATGNNSFTWLGSRVFLNGTGAVGFDLSSSAAGAVNLSVVDSAAVSGVKVVSLQNTSRMAWLGEVITLLGSDAIGFDLDGTAGTSGVSITMSHGTIDLTAAAAGASALRVRNSAQVNLNVTMMRHVSGVAGVNQVLDLSASTTPGSSVAVRGTIINLFNLTPQGICLSASSGPVTMTLEGSMWTCLSERVINWQSSVDVSTGASSVFRVSRLLSNSTTQPAVLISSSVPSPILCSGGSWEAPFSAIGVIRNSGGALQLDLHQVLAHASNPAAQALWIDSTLSTSSLGGQVKRIRCAGPCLTFAASGNATLGYALQFAVNTQATTSAAKPCVLLQSPITSLMLRLEGVFRKSISDGGTNPGDNSVLFFDQITSDASLPPLSLQNCVLASAGTPAVDAFSLQANPSSGTRKMRLYGNVCATLNLDAASVVTSVTPLIVDPDVV